MVRENRLRNVLLAFAFVAGAAAVPACHSSSAAPVSTTDPEKPYYRNPAADLTATPTVKFHFVSVTTNNNNGVDLVRSTFTDRLKQHLRGPFTTVTEGESAAAGEVVLDVEVAMNWGSRAGRYFSIGMGGRATITMKYRLKDGAGALLAKMDATDSMSGAGWSGGGAGGDSQQLVFNAADKWSSYFAKTILPKPAPAK
jgi:hypothetical protein